MEEKPASADPLDRCHHHRSRTMAEASESRSTRPSPGSLTRCSGRWAGGAVPQSSAPVRGSTGERSGGQVAGRGAELGMMIEILTNGSRLADRKILDLITWCRSSRRCGHEAGTRWHAAKTTAKPSTPSALTASAASRPGTKGSSNTTEAGPGSRCPRQTPSACSPSCTITRSSARGHTQIYFPKEQIAELARAASRDGATTEAWLQTGESYAFTVAASIRAVKETLTRFASGAVSPAAAFGADFAVTIPGTTRTDTTPAEVPVASRA